MLNVCTVQFMLSIDWQMYRVLKEGLIIFKEGTFEKLTIYVEVGVC